MAIPATRTAREFKKFVADDDGNTSIRVLGVACSASGGILGDTTSQNEMNKFAQADDGSTCVIFKSV